MEFLFWTFGILLYGLACYALGSAIWIQTVERRSRCGASRPVICVTSFLLGQSVLAALWLILALCGCLSATFVIAVVAAAFLVRILVKPSVDMGLFRNLFRAIGQLWSQGLIVRILFVAVLLVLVLFALQSLGPFLFYTGDATGFYMVFSKITAYTGRLLPPPGYEPFLQVGLFGELHYAALMAAGSGSLAKFFSYLEFIALAVLMMTMARGFGIGRIGQLLIVTMLLTSTTVAFYVYDGKVDLYGGALGMAAMYWVFQIGRDDSLRTYRLTGLFSGLAVQAKLSLAACLIPVVVLFVLWRRHRAKREKGNPEGFPGMVKVIAILFLWMLIGYLPQIVKNTVLFSEPFSPFLYIRSNPSWLSQSWIPADCIAGTILRYPLLLFFGRYPMQGGCLSPLILAMIPFAVLSPLGFLRKQRDLIHISLAGILGTALWILARPAVVSPRYILPMLLLFLFPAAFFGERIFLTGKPARILRMLVLVLALSLLGIEWMRCSPIGVYQRWKNPHYEGNYPDVRMSSYINQALAPGTPVLWMGYTKYWLNADLIIASRTPSSVITSPDPETNRESLTRNGISYILLDARTNKKDGERLVLDDKTPPEGITLMHREGELKFYRIDSPGNGPRSGGDSGSDSSPKTPDRSGVREP